MFLLANNNPVVPHQPRAILSNILLFSYSLLLLHPPKHCVKIVLYSELFWSAFPTNYFETMLLNMSDISMHHRNIQTLMIELFKIKYDLAPPIMDSLLNRRIVCYNFRNFQEFQSERKRMFYGLETTNYRAPQLWRILPEEFKQRNTISLFKSDVRQWICNECPSRLCKVFVPNLGFI